MAYRIGMAGVLLAFVTCVGLYIIGIRWLGDSDSLQHFDYAWQLSHGGLPDFSEGTQAPIVRNNGKAWSATPQFVAHHPPLYYAVIAPTTRLFVDAGMWQAGVLVARLITLAISIGGVFAVAWAGFVYGGRALSLSMAAFTASFTPFLGVSGDVMNDGLVLLASALAIGVVVQINLDVPTTRRLFILGAACIVGMATKATFIGVLLASLAGVVSAYILRDGWRRGLVAAIAPVFLVCVSVAAFTEWFYTRNFMISGKWYRASDQSWVADAQGRIYKDFWTLVSGGYGGRMYTFLTDSFYGTNRPWRGWPQIGGLDINVIASRVVTYIALAVAVAAAVMTVSTSTIRSRRALILLGFAVLIVGSWAIVLRHATGYGSINVRYMLPAIVPIAFLFAAPALRFGRIGVVWLSAFLGLAWTGSAANVFWAVSQRFQKSDANDFADFQAAVAGNGIPPALTYVLLALTAIGFAMQVWAVWSISAAEPKTRSSDSAAA